MCISDICNILLTPAFGSKMHAGNAGIKTDKLETLRIAVAKDSPMWETLDICIKVVDKNSLDLLVPRLAQMIRSAVGLNTRLGLYSLVHDILKCFISHYF